MIRMSWHCAGTKTGESTSPSCMVGAPSSTIEGTLQLEWPQQSNVDIQPPRGGLV